MRAPSGVIRGQSDGYGGRPCVGCGKARAIVSRVSVLLLARVDDISMDADTAESENMSESELEDDGEVAMASGAAGNDEP